MAVKMSRLTLRRRYLGFGGKSFIRTPYSQRIYLERLSETDDILKLPFEQVFPQLNSC